MLVRVVIEVPKKLTKAQRELLQKLESELNEKNFEKKSGFKEKLKKLGEDLKKGMGM